MFTVAIVGRPNVGKSTLFNKFAKKRLAVVEDTPGITRDRLYCEVTYYEKPFVVVDTGGIVFDEKDSLAEKVRKQVEFAISEADLILFMVDGKEGLLPLDEEVADFVRRSNRPVFLVVNKTESPRVEESAKAEFTSLGFNEVFFISAAHNKGLYELIERIMEFIPPSPVILPTVRRFAVVGKPNVGKSSFVNAILGEERVVVHSEPGTTRDATDVFLEFKGKKLALVDTAGLRRKSRIEDAVEFYSILRTKRAIERSDVVFVMMDATQPITRQDKRIVAEVESARRGIVLLLNKMDIVPEDKRSPVKEYFYEELFFVPYVPVLSISALKGWGVEEAMDVGMEVYRRYKNPPSDKALFEVITRAVLKHHPPSVGRKPARVYDVYKRFPDAWVVIVETNEPKAFKEDYKRFLLNELYRNLDAEGVPIKMEVRKKGKR